MTKPGSPQNPLDRLVRALTRLPGIGEKSATRLALFILRDTRGLIHELIQALTHVRDRVRFCKVCQNLSEEDICLLCSDEEGRDRSLLCVVQEPVDLLMMEKTGHYRGLYHILHGSLSPLDGVGPEDIRIESLMTRLRAGGIREVVLATNANAEGDATALYLKKLIDPLGIKVTRLASGVPVGGLLEYTDAQTLARALGNRGIF